MCHLELILTMLRLSLRWWLQVVLFIIIQQIFWVYYHLLLDEPTMTALKQIDTDQMMKMMQKNGSAACFISKLSNCCWTFAFSVFPVNLMTIFCQFMCNTRCFSSCTSTWYLLLTHKQQHMYWSICRYHYQTLSYTSYTSTI